MKDKSFTYQDYWNSKGTYGKERIRRFLIRKEKRFRSHSCPKCKRNPKESYHPCPFSVDMYGDYESRCRCCNDCQYNCSMDI